MLFLMSLAQDASEEDWKKDYFDNLDTIENHDNYQWKDKSLNINSKIRILLMDRAKAAIGKDLLIREFGTIQRHYPGSSLPEHTDTGYGTMPKYATVLYLNDDYLGGELYFSKFNLEFKFPKRSLVIFDTDDNYEHGVKEVLEGPTRYVITNFIFKNTD